MVKSHFVPQFYLKNFSISGESERVYVYRRDREDPRNTHVSKIAAVKGFYSVMLKETGEASDMIEEMFSELEGDASRLMKRLINGNTSVVFSEDERATLSTFIAFLFLRGPSFRQKELNLRVAVVEGPAAEIAQDVEAFRADMERAGVPFDNEEQFEAVRKQFVEKITNHYKFQYERGKQGDLIESMIEGALMLAPTIFYKEWVLLECNTEVFITSDNPLTLMQPTDMPHAEVDSFMNLKIVLPISPSRCLVLDNGLVSENLNVIAVERQGVLNINRSTMFNAYREIYSNRASRRIKKAFNRTKDGESEKVYLDGYDPKKHGYSTTPFG